MESRLVIAMIAARISDEGGSFRFTGRSIV